MSIFKKSPTLVATISLFPDLNSKVEFSPTNAPTAHFVELALVYGAKVRWLVNTEPQAVKTALIEWCNNCMESWKRVPAGELYNELVSELKMKGIGTSSPATVPGGEIFTIKYYSSWRVWNELPRNGMSINLAWHYIVLLNAFHERFQGPNGNPMAYVPLWQFWSKDFQNAEALNDPGLKTLKLLTDKTQEIYKNFILTLNQINS